jgi:hypothetical protein
MVFLLKLHHQRSMFCLPSKSYYQKSYGCFWTLFFPLIKSESPPFYASLGWRLSQTEPMFFQYLFFRKLRKVRHNVLSVVQKHQGRCTLTPPGRRYALSQNCTRAEGCAELCFEIPNIDLFIGFLFWSRTKNDHSFYMSLPSKMMPCMLHECCWSSLFTFEIHPGVLHLPGFCVCLKSEMVLIMSGPFVCSNRETDLIMSVSNDYFCIIFQKGGGSLVCSTAYGSACAGVNDSCWALLFSSLYI